MLLKIAPRLDTLWKTRAGEYSLDVACFWTGSVTVVF